MPYLFLGLIQIIAEFPQEIIAVHVEAGGSGEHLRICRPAHSLIPLWAVRRNIHIIAFLSPQCVLNQLVDLLIAGTDPSGALQIAVQHTSGKLIQLYLFRKSGKLHITEAIVGEMRLHFSGCTVRDICKFSLSCTQVITIEVTLLQHFAKLHINLRSCRLIY